MTSSASSAAWLPAAIARAAVVHPSPAVHTRGRHTAPDAGGVVEIVALDQVGPGRHAESEWSRELYDPCRDEDPWDWLGFSA